MNAKEIRNLQEAYLEVYSDIAESAIGGRARRVVNNQRGGFHGDDDAMNQAQKGLAASMEKLKNTPSSYVSRASADRAAKAAAEKVKSGRVKFEQVDVYDVVLSHLLDEGYAETQEAAEVIMANMSEDWRNEIVEEILNERNDEGPQPSMRQLDKEESARRAQSGSAPETYEQRVKRKAAEQRARGYGRGGYGRRY